ncbi:hypothetical protein [Nostoc sp.]
MLRKILFKHPLSSTLSKIKNWFSLSGKNPGFLANTFSTSQIIDEVKKVKLLSHKGYSDSLSVAKKMNKVELRGCLSSLKVYQKNSLPFVPPKGQEAFKAPYSLVEKGIWGLSLGAFGVSNNTFKTSS